MVSVKVARGRGYFFGGGFQPQIAQILKFELVVLVVRSVALGTKAQSSKHQNLSNLRNLWMIYSVRRASSWVRVERSALDRVA
jgi:hypothetical protein